ncbi:MAG: trypsin-like peptidase domain-containing protein [Cyanobacteria bacterium CRU_2_1]|nr:trypsin-like peptidase domain-containing protein [Cyanobacteria bacterium RU_5_0]NJR62333.1 trypsin-like peptidase domain-containing protein [Cyanobacteria bacterium CRU_2_1]
MKLEMGWGAILSGTAIVSALVMMLPSIGISSDVAQIAESITVLIDIEGLPSRTGSGVIIARNNDTYYVLTAAHVVQRPDYPYVIVTPDQQRYSLDYQTVKIIPNIDLAILEFTSSQTYSVARLADSNQVNVGDPVYVGGFPSVGGSVTQQGFRFLDDGSIAQIFDPPLEQGYALVYRQDTVAGMSGGPVLDQVGRLVGIHGQLEITEDGMAQPFPYGIPIQTFVQLADSTNIDLNDLGVRVDSTPIDVLVSQPSPSAPATPPAGSLPTRPPVVPTGGNTTPGAICPGRSC